LNKILWSLLAGFVLGGLAVGAWLSTRHEDDPARKKEEAAAETSYVQHGTNGHSTLKLDQATQTRMGLQVASLPSAQARPVTSGFARILDPAPLAAAVVESSSLQLESQAATREWERTRLLASQQNASERALQAAELAATRARLQQEAAQQKLIAAWGTQLARRPDLPSLATNLVQSEAALVRIDLPAGTTASNTPVAARLHRLGKEDAPLEVILLGEAPAVDPVFQGQAYLGLITQPGNVRPGTALTASIEWTGQPWEGVVVPREAIVRDRAKTFVYRQESDETFQRIEVELDHPLDAGWFVREGLAAAQKVVITGAAQLLSEERKDEGGPE